jgi:hypothetical protein
VAYPDTRFERTLTPVALVVTFADPEPTALPGGEGFVNIEVTNLGEIVEQVRVEVLGPVATYTTIDPGELHLYPGTSGTVLLRFKPIAGHMPGQVPFAVRAASTVSGDFTIEEAVLQIGAKTAFSADLRPRQSRARRRAKHRVTIFNDGNAPVTVRMAATDPDELLLLKMADSITVQPGGAAVARLSAKVMAGSPGDIHQFKVFLEDGASPSITLDGSVRTRRTAKWPFVAAVAVIGGLLIAFFLNRPKDPITGAIELTSAESTTTTVAVAGPGATTPGGGPAPTTPGGGPAPAPPGGAPTTKPAATATTPKATAATPGPIAPPQTPPKIVQATTSTTSLGRGEKSAAEKLLQAWSTNNVGEMSKYGTAAVVQAMSKRGAQAVSPTTSEGPQVGVVCSSSSSPGAKVLDFGSGGGYVVQIVTFCDGSTAR